MEVELLYCFYFLLPTITDWKIDTQLQTFEKKRKEVNIDDYEGRVIKKYEISGA